MKKILIVLYLGLTVGVIGLVPVGIAMAQESSDLTVNIDKTDGEEAAEDGEGFSVSFSIGEDDDSAEQKLDKLVEKSTIVLGDETGEELRAKLGSMSAQEKRDLVERISDGFSYRTGGDGGMGVSESIIGLVAVILSLGMPVTILLLVLWFGHRKRKQKMELIRTYLDAGKDVPEQVLEDFAGRSGNSLRSGVTPLAVGAGMIAASFIIEDATPLAAFGLIPLFIGIARLIYWKYETKPQNDSNV